MMHVKKKLIEPIELWFKTYWSNLKMEKKRPNSEFYLNIKLFFWGLKYKIVIVADK